MIYRLSGTLAGGRFYISVQNGPLAGLLESEIGDMKHPRSGVIAIYPGSFDPITSGHLDIIERGSRMFSRVIVAVLQNEAKQPLFTVEERMEMLRESLAKFSGVEVDTFQGLLADYALANGAGVILRGIRAISD